MIQDHQAFFLITATVYPLGGLLLLFLWAGVKRQTKTLRPASYLRRLALWLIFSSFLLYVLQLVFPLLAVYVLYLLCGVITLHLYMRFTIEKNDFFHQQSLAASIINSIVLAFYAFSSLPLVLSTILLTLTSLDPFFVMLLSYTAPLAWGSLDVLVLWRYGKKKQWDMVPLFFLAKSKP